MYSLGLVHEKISVWNAKSFHSQNSHVGPAILIHGTRPKLDMWDLNGSNVNFFLYLVEGLGFLFQKFNF